MSGEPIDLWIGEVVAQLRNGEAVRRELPGGGVISIERALPYLFVYRTASSPADQVTPRLLRGEASYLIWAGGPGDDDELRTLLRELMTAGTEDFGAVLLIELWAVRSEEPTFRLLCPDLEAAGTAEVLAAELAEIREIEPEARVAVEHTVDRHPPGLEPLFTVSELYELECLLLGLEIPAIYLQPVPPGEPARDFPVFFRQFQGHLARALRRAVYDFLRVQTDAHIETYRMLGRRTIDDAVWQADHALAELGRSFDFLLLIAPVNEYEAWLAFRESGFGRLPEFRQRLLPIAPDQLKRQLWSIDLGSVDDPSLLYLLTDKRDELDKQISMLAGLRTRDFFYGSVRLYGPVSDELLRAAEELLTELPGVEGHEADDGMGPGADRDRGPGASSTVVGAVEFERYALEEFAYYREHYPDFQPEAQVRPDVVGLQVSRGNLLIDERIDLAPERVEALIQHEVGTHILTYFNGAAQPLHQLAAGLAEYDELQEGLGILAEYLVDGLTPSRMRVLAARVVAARAVENGADFIETFRALVDRYGFSAGSAFDIATRAHEGGGHTRDLIYLRGLIRVREFLVEGGEIEPLYIGKIAYKHLPIIAELRERGILREPPLRPRFLDRPEVRERLEALRRGLPLAQMVRRATTP